MKSFQKILVGFATLLIAGTALAKQQASCPSVATVNAHANFVYAMEISPDNNAWALISDSFTDLNTEWRVGLGVVLPNATSQADALVQGQEYYQNNVVLNDPVVSQQVENVCVYSPEQSQEYIVIAMKSGSLNLLNKLFHSVK